MGEEVGVSGGADCLDFSADDDDSCRIMDTCGTLEETGGVDFAVDFAMGAEQKNKKTVYLAS